MTVHTRIVEGELVLPAAPMNFADWSIELSRTTLVRRVGGASAVEASQLLARARVRKGGKFTLEVVDDGTTFDALLLGGRKRRNELKFHVFVASERITAPEGVVGSFEATDNEVTVSVEVAPPSTIPAPANKLDVAVIRPDGFGIEGLRVKVARVGGTLSSPVEGTTDVNGRCSLTHDWSTELDVVVKVYPPVGTEVIAVGSRLDDVDHYAFDRIVVPWSVEIAAPPAPTPFNDAPSLFERIDGALRDLYVTGGGGPDVDVLGRFSDKFAFDEADVGWYAAARELASTLDGGAAPALPAYLFGLFRGGERPLLAHLAGLPYTAFKQSLVLSVAEREVPKALLTEAEMVAIYATLGSAAVKEIAPLSPPQNSAASRRQDLHSLATTIAFPGGVNPPDRAAFEKLAKLMLRDDVDDGAVFAQWKSSVNPALSDGQVGATQMRLQLARIFARHTGCLSALMSTHGSVIAGLSSNIVWLTDAQIGAVVDAGVASDDLVGWGFVGTTASTRTSNLKVLVLDNIEDEFPSALVVARLQQDTWAEHEGQALAKHFFNFALNPANRPFDLASSPPSFISGEPSTATWQKPGPTEMSPDERKELRRFLESVQRVFRLTDPEGRRNRLGNVSRYAQVKAVLQAGYGSAWEITQAGLRRFMRQMGANNAVQRRLWSRVYDRAEQQAAAALITWAELDPSFDSPALPVLPSFAKAKAAGLEEASGLDDLGSLAPTFISPPHGDSVLSPAAYLIDLFGFMRNDATWEITDPAPVQRSAADLLFEERRPDIEHLALSSENADTTLPQIDLVNELLARMVSSASVPTPAGGIETKGTSAERRVAPERLDPAAYTAAMNSVGSAAFPLQLPRTIPLDRAWALGELVGLDLGAATRVFRANVREAAYGARWADEQLRLHPEQWDRATTPAGATSPNDADRLGFSGAVDFDSLKSVVGLMQRFSISHDELLDTVKIGWLGLHYGVDDSAGNPLDIAAHRVYGSTPGTSAMSVAQAIRLQGIIRLSRLTGMPVPVLARVLPQLAPDGAGGVNLAHSDLKSRLAVLHWAANKLNKAADEVLAIWEPLNTQGLRDGDALGGRSPFERLFVPANADIALLNALEVLKTGTIPGGLSTYNLRSRDTNETATGGKDYASPYRLREAVRAATGATPEAFDALLAVIEPDLSVAVNATLETVSKLVGLGFICALSELPPTDLSVTLRVLPPPVLVDGWPSHFTLTAPTRLLSFVDDAAELRRGPLGADLVRLLCDAPPSAGPPFPVDDQDLARKFGLDSDAVVESLASLFVELRATSASERVAAWHDWFAAASGLPRAQAVRICSIVVDADCFGFASDRAQESPTEEGFLYVSQPLDPEEPAEPADPVAHVQGLKERYVRLYIAQRKVALVVQRLGVTDAELDAVLYTVPPPAEPPEPAPTPPALAGWCGEGTAPALRDAWMNLYTTPYRWVSLRNAQRLFALRPPNSSYDLVGVAETLAGVVDSDDWVENHAAGLCAAYGWERAELDALFDIVEPPWSPTGLPRSVDGLEYLVLTQAAAAPLGVSAPSLVRALTPLAGAGTVQAAVRLGDLLERVGAARLGQAWASQVTPINDRLRVLERDSLLAYLIGDPAVLAENVNDVYGYLLIDPMVEPSVLTSRLIAATNSAQLLVHRILLGLEGGASLPQAAEERWVWLKSYRVWEAARKVYLWPENWLQPELRGGRTPEFDTLLSAIQESELTAERARDAYLTYLSSVSDLSRVKVVAVLPWVEDGDDAEERDELYLFGRSPSAPGTLLWRRRESSGRWTPWGDTGLQAEGDHVLPVVHHGRLLCVWPTFEVTVRTETIPNDNGGEESEREIPGLYISLTAAELRGEQWAPPASTGERVHLEAVVDGSARRVDPRNIYFRTAFPTSPNEDTLRSDDLVVTGWVVATEGERTGAPALVAGFRYDMARGSFDAFSEPRKDLWADSGGGWRRDRNHWVPPEAIPVNQAYYDAIGPFKLEDDGEETPGATTTVLTKALLGQRLVVPPNRFNWSVKRSPAVLQVNGESYLLRSVRPAARGDRLTTAFSARELFRDGEGRDRWAPTAQLPELSEEAMRAERPRRRRRIATGSAGWFAPRSDAATPRGTERSGTTSRGLGGARDTGATPRELRATGASAAVHAIECARNTTGVSAAARLRRARRIRFEPLHHPYVDRFLEAVRRGGVMELLRPDPDGPNRDLVRQHLRDESYFNTAYEPSRAVESPLAVREVSFDLETPAGLWNWELFFHAPMAIAAELRRQKQFEQALDWMHAVFNPMGLVDDGDSDGGGDDPFWQRARRSWRVRPLAQGIRKHWRRLRKLMTTVGFTPDADLEHLTDQLAAWREDPFDPHRLASVRVSAYRKWVVMAYLETLIEWGDTLFSHDTRESINEAMQLYMVAHELLGPKPVAAEWSAQELGSSDITLHGLRMGTAKPPGSFGNYELRIAPVPGARARAGWRRGLRGLDSLIWFAVPPNTKLLGYWVLVDDRITKIRRGANIDGTIRPLSLLAPEIDPGALIAAVMAGQGLAAVLAETVIAPPPTIRFSAWLGRAGAVVQSVKALGAALQSALEKADGEALSQLRQRHELAILRMTEEVRRRDVEEAERALAGLQEQVENAAWRRKHYSDLLAEGVISEEKNAADKAERAQRKANIAAFSSAGLALTSAAVDRLGIVRNTNKGRGWSFTIKDPGALLQLGQAGVNALQHWASFHSFESSVLSRRGSNIRRAQDWRFQMDSAGREVRALEPQIRSAELRLANARQQLKIFRMQRDQAQQIEEFLRTKYSSQALYQFQANALRTLYYQTYQLAFRLARLAEESFNFELSSSKQFIRFGYWNGARNGLLAGEYLHQDLERMEVAYLEDNVREREITRSISLASLDPIAMEHLREAGKTEFDVPEVLFDLDHGHMWFRKLRSVATTISAVSGRFAPVSGRLRMVSSGIRASNSGAVVLGATVEAVSLSHGQDDPGVFQLDHGDPRYVPFEQKGAVARWAIELAGADVDNGSKQIDWRQISDVVLTLRYTARMPSVDHSPRYSVMLGNFTCRVKADFDGIKVAWSAVRDFPDAWQRFVDPGGEDFKVLRLRLGRSALPTEFMSFGALKVQRVAVGFRLTTAVSSLGSATIAVGTDRYLVGSSSASSTSVPLNAPSLGLSSVAGAELTHVKTGTATPAALPGSPVIQLEDEVEVVISLPTLVPEDVVDLFLIALVSP